MDPRLERYADLICDYSLRVRAGHLLLIDTPVAGEPLAVAVARAAWRRGADATVLTDDEDLDRSLLEHGSDEQVAYYHPVRERLLADADARLLIEAPTNTRAGSGVDGSRQALRRRAGLHLGELADRRTAAGELRWLICAYPTHAAAQEAGMGLLAWSRFIYSACLLDEPDPAGAWMALRDRQLRLVERLEAASELRILSEGTDLRLSIAGVQWESSAGEANLPDGEVFCSPPSEHVEGEIRFDVPSMHDGRRYEGVRLVFRGGEVVEHDADVNAAALGEVLATDDGARRLGEVAIATNSAITRAVGSTLFDEKIGGTVHCALGRGFPELGGTNVSAIHWDLIRDLRGGGAVHVDGLELVRDGRILL